jgi:hypothetical protein
MARLERFKTTKDTTAARDARLATTHIAQPTTRSS